MAPRAARTRSCWSRTSRWSPWTSGAAGQQITLRGLDGGADAADARAPRAALGRRLRARCSTSGPTIRARWSPPSRWSRARLPGDRDARGTRRPLLPAGSARVGPGAPRDQRAGTARGLPGVGGHADHRAGSGRQRHLGDRGARELALGGRRASDGADPHGRGLPDAGRHLPQRPGRARGPQRQAAVRPHRVGGPRGDGPVRPRPGIRRRRARRLLDGRRRRSWPSCSARTSRARCER